MKLKFDVECTPEEARAFLGLPDVSGLQKAVLERVEERTMAYFDSLDPEKLAGLWMPMGTQGFEAMRNVFTQFANAAQGGGRPSKD